MKYPCGLIQDLLPLYYDGVCSEESIAIIENHLSECAECKKHYTALGETDDIIITSQNPDLEMKKAASYQAVKRKLHRKQVLIVIITVALLAVIALSVVGFLKNNEQTIIYEDNISVSMTDDSLIGRLQGDEAHYLKVKRVEFAADGQKKIYLFFYLSGTKWSDLTTSDRVFSEYVLCAADKGAAQIDSVFYYTGDYTEIENISEDKLKNVIDNSTLLWSK